MATAEVTTVADRSPPDPLLVIAPILTPRNAELISVSAWEYVSDTLFVSFAASGGDTVAHHLVGTPSPYPLHPRPFYSAGAVAVPVPQARTEVSVRVSDHAGNSNTVQRTVVKSAPVKSVVAGASHWCALLVDGTVQCGGGNEYGQLGDGTTTASSTPVQVSGGLTFDRIFAGLFTTCALTIARELYCWGGVEWRDDLSGVWPSHPTPEPTRVAIGLQFVSIAIGKGHMCGIVVGGSVYCWGVNGSGQVGDGTTEFQSEPVATASSLAFSSLAAGQFHTCGLTDQTIMCWGDNYAGQLGDGTTESRAVPVAVDAELPFRSVTAGVWQTCGVALDGAAYCWGNSGSNRLGFPSHGEAVTSPRKILIDEAVSAISVLMDWGCATSTAGNTHCWGGPHWSVTEMHPLGTLFANPLSPQSYPMLTAYGLELESVATTAYGACAASTAGALYCWGASDYTRSRRFVEH